MFILHYYIQVSKVCSHSWNQIDHLGQRSGKKEKEAETIKTTGHTFK